MVLIFLICIHKGYVHTGSFFYIGQCDIHSMPDDF